MGGGRAVHFAARRITAHLVASALILAVVGTAPGATAATSIARMAAVEPSALKAQASAAIGANNTENPRALGIARAVTGAISASSQPTTTFTDLKGVQWAAPAIAVLAQEAILDGTAPHTFNPDGDISEAQVVTVVRRLLGAPKAPNTGQTPPNTPEWARSSLLWATHTKLLVGIPLPTNPTAAITREQAIAILLNGIGLESLANSARAMESPLSLAGSPEPWAHGYLVLAVDLGLIQGDEGSLDARQALSRAELSVILARICAVEATAGTTAAHSAQGSGLGSGITTPPLAGS